MKKSFKLEDLECAKCAAKMEDAISKLDGVNSCKIGFMTQKMTLDVEEETMDKVLDEAQKIISKIERHCKIVR